MTGERHHEHGEHHAETDDLVRTLRSYGCLTKDRLIELSGAEHWRAHTFNTALGDAVAQGRIKKLSEDLFELGDSESGDN